MTTLGFSKRHYGRLLKQEKDKLLSEANVDQELETISVRSYNFISDNIIEVDGFSQIINNKSLSTLKEKLANWFIDENISYNAGNKLSDPRMIGELQDLKETITLMKTGLERQTVAVTEQTLKINKIYEKLFGVPAADVFDFPLKTIADLEALDKKLQLDPNFEMDVKVLLGTKLRSKVSSNFSIIANNPLTEVSWNGRKNMKPINAYKFFHSTLYGCVNSFYTSFEDYEKDIKDAIKKGKNRMDQSKHKLRLQNKMIL